MKSILLVGEQNPHGSDPRFALYPLPAHASGGRLMRILGQTREEYMRLHDRVNLCYDAWDAAEARATACRILETRPPTSGIVICGAKGAKAFGFPYTPFTLPRVCGPFHILILPHPSGLCRIWNEPTAIDSARASYAELVRRVSATFRPEQAAGDAGGAADGS